MNERTTATATTTQNKRYTQTDAINQDESAATALN